MKFSGLLFLILGTTASAYAEGYTCKLNGEIQGTPLNLVLNTEDHGTNFSGKDFQNYGFSVETSGSDMYFSIEKCDEDLDLIPIVDITSTSATGTLSLPANDGVVNYDCSKNN